MVIWTPRAQTDLKAIYKYIYEDSPINAKKVIDRIMAKAGGLDSFPGKHKNVPEDHTRELLEVSVSAWRIIYHPRNNNIHIITVVHKRQVLTESRINH